MSASELQKAALKLASENPEFREALRAEISKEAKTRVRSQMNTRFVFQGSVKPSADGSKHLTGVLSFRFGQTSETMSTKVSCILGADLKLGNCKASSKELVPLCLAALQTLIDNDSLVM